MKEFDCRSELVLRERRGQLSTAERAALDAHLATCESCRLSHRLGLDFDAAETLKLDDGPRLERLGMVARNGPRSRPSASVHVLPRRRRLVMPLVAAVALLAALGAGATMGLFAGGGGAPDSTPPALDKPSSQPVARAETERPAPPAVRDEPAPNPPTVEAQKPAAPALAVVAPAPLSASELFQEANEARRAGHTGKAITLFSRLVRDFPSAPEASLSHLRLGVLRLQSGSPAAALKSFDRHLASSGDRVLAPEALYGRGRALAALGNVSEERRTWTRLLAEFPSSPYASHARRRLQALGG